MGIEPIDPDQNTPEKTDSSSTLQDKRALIRAQISGADCPLLAQLVARWPELPAQAREAIISVFLWGIGENSGIEVRIL